MFCASKADRRLINKVVQGINLVLGGINSIQMVHHSEIQGNLVAVD